MRVFFLSSAPIHRKTITRVDGIVAAGGSVSVAGFVRENFQDTAALTFPVESLGAVRNGDLAGRALAAPLHFLRAVTAGRRCADCDTIWTNSLDMLLLGIAARPFLRGRQRIVYDVADLTPKQLSPGPLGWALRALERLACASIDALVLTSPWFYWAYYKTMAPGARAFLLENKVSPPAPPALPSPPAPPWRIVWNGQLRCRRSLAFIVALAEALPDRVEVHAWGHVLEHLRDDFRIANDGLANFFHHGPYSDTDLTPVFAGAHFIYAYDLDDGRNSELLLSNRLYHGAARALPTLAIARTAVGMTVDALKLGRAFEASSAAPLVDFFRGLTPEKYEAMRDDISADRRAGAVYGDDVARLMADIVSGGRANAIPASETTTIVLARTTSPPANRQTA